MSKRKKNHSSGGAQYQGFYAHIAVCGLKNPQEFKRACMETDEESYIIGREDKKLGYEIMPIAEFARSLDEFKLPPAILEGLIRANYAAYLDGYHGKEFKIRTIIEEV